MSVSAEDASAAATVGFAFLGSAGEIVDRTTVLSAPVDTNGFVTLARTLTIPPRVTEVRVELKGFTLTDASTSGEVVFDDVALY